MSSKRLLPAIVLQFFLLTFNRSLAQIDTAVLYTHIPYDYQAWIITNPRNHVKYVLDSSHIYIEAITQNGNRLWRTDPWMDYKWKTPPDERPIIITFLLKNDSSTHFRDVLAIDYNNKGGAIIDAKTGKIIEIGQD